jgi:hypothetical protein
VAESLASTDPALDNFKEIAQRAGWTGTLALNCGLGADGLPLSLVGLLGGMNEELRVHHIGIDLNQIQPEPILLTNSSVFGLIRYPSPLAPPFDVGKTSRTVDPAAPFDYAVEQLTIDFRNSALRDFDCTVRLTTNELFGRPVTLNGAAGNDIVIVGTCQQQSGRSAFLFKASGPSTFDFPVLTDEVRILSRCTFSEIEFTTVSYEKELVVAQFALNGAIEFRENVLPFEAFGFSGQQHALPLTSLAIDVQFRLPEPSRVPIDRTFAFNAANVQVDGGSAVAIQDSLPGSFPLTLKAFRADPRGLPALQVVQFGELNEANLQTPRPHYALDYLLPLGTLGALSSVHASFDAHLIVGWGPHPSMTGSDGVAVAIELPGVTPGFRGMELQGVLKTSFGTANMARFPGSADGGGRESYVLSFNDVGLRLFGYKLPPGIIIDALLFAAVGDPALSNLGWYLGVKQE